MYPGAPAREPLVRRQQSNNPHIVGLPTSADRQRTSHVTAIKINTTHINHFISPPTQMEQEWHIAVNIIFMMMATQGHESQKSSDLPEGPQSFSPFPHLPLEGSIRGLHIQNIDGGCVDLRKTSTIHPNDLPGFQSEWVVSPP